MNPQKALRLFLFSYTHLDGWKEVVALHSVFWGPPQIINQYYWLIHLKITKADYASNSDLMSHSFCCDFKNQIKPLPAAAPTGFGEMKVSACLCRHTRQLDA
jgi:hypothetical protein